MLNIIMDVIAHSCRNAIKYEFISRVTAQAMLWPGILYVARSRPLAAASVVI